jgi:nicotinamide mononucleotide adenylyltransferase
VVIGLGSCNKYNLRNPFTAEESREMIDAFLSKRFSNYSFIEIPDFAHIPAYSDGRKWKEYVTGHYGSLDCFVSGNDYVNSLLDDVYRVMWPGDIVPPERRVWAKGTQVRLEIARFGDWRSFVPDETAEYLESNGLIQRFRKEFGLETLAHLEEGFEFHESAAQEYRHTVEV